MVETVDNLYLLWEYVLVAHVEKKLRVRYTPSIKFNNDFYAPYKNLKFVSLSFSILRFLIPTCAWITVPPYSLLPLLWLINYPFNYPTLYESTNNSNTSEDLKFDRSHIPTKSVLALATKTQNRWKNVWENYWRSQYSCWHGTKKIYFEVTERA